MLSARRPVSLALIRDAAHHEDVIEAGIRRAQVSVWIATANLKDVHLQASIGTRARARGRYVSVLEVFEELAGRGVELRILHGCPPSRRFSERLRGHRALGGGALELRQCPRVHMKMIVVDGALLYLGSANFTGAGLGAKSEGRRNFEAGVITDDELLIDEMQGTFDAIWTGRRCGACRLRSECPAPLDSQ